MTFIYTGWRVKSLTVVSIEIKNSTKICKHTKFDNNRNFSINRQILEAVIKTDFFKQTTMLYRKDTVLAAFFNCSSVAVTHEYMGGAHLY